MYERLVNVWNIASPDISPHRTAVKSEWCELLSSWIEENKSWLSTIGLGKVPKLSSKYVAFFFFKYVVYSPVRILKFQKCSLVLSKGALFGSCDVVLSATIWRVLESARDEMESKSPERRLQASDRVCLGNSEI
jgi:hypothetical protein